VKKIILKKIATIVLASFLVSLISPSFSSHKNPENTARAAAIALNLKLGNFVWNNEEKTEIALQVNYNSYNNGASTPMDTRLFFKKDAQINTMQDFPTDDVAIMDPASNPKKAMVYYKLTTNIGNSDLFPRCTVESNGIFKETSSDTIWGGGFHLSCPLEYWANSKTNKKVGYWPYDDPPDVDADLFEAVFSTIGVNKSFPIVAYKGATDASTPKEKCSTLLGQWNEYKTELRELMMPLPGTVIGHSENPNFEVLGPEGSIRAQILVNARRTFFIDLAKWTQKENESKDYKFDVDILDLTPEGKIRLEGIAQLAKNLNTTLEAIKSSTPPTDDIATFCGKDYRIVPFKWLESLEKTWPAYTKFSDMQTRVAELKASATSMVATLEAPEEVSDDVCSKIGGSGVPGYLLQAFCGLGQLLEAWANSLLNLAFCYLQTSLGYTNSKPTEWSACKRTTDSTPPPSTTCKGIPDTSTF